MAKADWVAIKTEYITTNISYRKMVEKYDVSFAVLKDRAKKENWVEARKKHRHSVITKATRKVETKQVNVLAKELMLADKITAVLNKALSDSVQFNRHLVQRKESVGFDKNEWVEEMQFTKIDMKALKEAAETLKIVEDMKRRMNNMLTEPERQKLEIEREKLAMEKAKVVGLDDEDDNTGVIVIAEILEDEDEEDEEVQSGAAGQQLCDSGEEVVPVA